MKNHWLKKAEQKQSYLKADYSHFFLILGKIQTVLSEKSEKAVARATALLQKATVPIYRNKQLIKVNRPFDHLSFLEWCECNDSELYELMFDIDDDEFDDDILVVGDDQEDD